MKSIVTIFLFLFLFICLLGAYLFGKKSATDTIEKNYINNVVLVRNIAQLNSLEVYGIAKLKQSNANNSGMLESMQTYFNEKTLFIDVPYIAKYGVDMNKNLNIVQATDSIRIMLPMPELLSFELRMDKCQSITKKGLLIQNNDNELLDITKELYREQRAALEQNTVYLNQAKEKIESILKIYYAPIGMPVSVVFKEMKNDMFKL